MAPLLISISFKVIPCSTVSTPYHVYIPREEVRALILFGNRAQALDPWLSRWLTCWSDKQNAIQDCKIVTIHFPLDRCVCILSRYIKTYESNNLFVRIRNIVNKKMRLCQLMFIGEVELAGDLLEIAYLLVSKSISNKMWVIISSLILSFSFVGNVNNTIVPFITHDLSLHRDVIGHLKASWWTNLFSREYD